MRLTSKLFPLFLLFTLLITTGQGCGGPTTAELEADKPVTLTVWRVFDEGDTMRGIFNAYQALHSNVSFEYRQLRIDEYRDELLRAFAQGTGPDIFSMHNTWIPEYESLMEPLPPSVTIPFVEIKGSLKKERIVTLVDKPTIKPAQVRRDFVDVVGKDVIRDFRADPRARVEEKVFGLPLSVDTLALYYNRDLLNAASIPEPPRTWKEFQDATIALTTIGAEDAVIQAGAAIGTSQNVERAFDILSLLMMQNGTPMTDEQDRPTFAALDRETRISPGANAVRFFTDFANPQKEVYTWNTSQPNSFDTFTSGKSAFFFGYSYHLPLIEARAPRLNFDIAAMPQIENGRTVNYANYWVESVAKSTPNPDWAWDFVQFATAAEQVQSYLTAANKPTALRGLINNQIDHDDLGVFVSQLLTAESWYKGENAPAAEQAFEELIDAVNAGAIAEEEIVKAQSKVIQTSDL